MRSEFAPIAIEHLLLHSAGLIRGTEMTADSRFDVWALRDTQTGFAPGERHYYSNVGYRTLGYALETAAGVPYPELLRARILEPIGLEHTVPEITVDIRDRMAVGYDRLHDDRTPSPDDPLFPAAVARDGDGRRLPRLERRRSGGFRRVISLAGRRRTLTSGPLLDSGHGWSYGYGLERKGSLFGHGGSMPGFASSMLGDLDSGFAVGSAHERAGRAQRDGGRRAVRARPPPRRGPGASG